MTSIFNWNTNSWKAREPDPFEGLSDTDIEALRKLRNQPTIIEELDEAGLDVWELGKAIRRVAALTDGELVNEARDLCAHADAMARLMERVVLLFRDAK